MKRKYILENYDRIFSEIKNPKIIFATDLTKFSLESFLAHQVIFSREDGEVIFKCKLPFHNLHPKFSKLIFKNSAGNAAFENEIPNIINYLKIDRSKCSWKWCAKNKYHLYIFQDCKLEQLIEEERFFLYCYQTLKNENDRIKKINKEHIFNLNSRAKIEQYIHQKQYALENLAQRLIKEINPKSPNHLYQYSDKYDKYDCLKITYIYVEKLHRFIEKEFSPYLNLNSTIPLKSSFEKEFPVSKTIEEIESVLLKSSINETLLKMIFEPLNKITLVNFTEKISYYDFKYCSEFARELHKLSQSGELTETIILDCLLNLNFNSLQLFKYITTSIVEELNSIENNVQKTDILYRILKEYNQIQLRESLKYKRNLQSIKKQIVGWIEEEIEYLHKIINTESSTIKKVVPLLQKEKFLTTLSVAQLSAFFGILMETEIIKHKNQTDVFKFIAENFKTKNTEQISIDSIKVKYYNVESSTRKVLREKIIELLNLTKQ